MSNNSMGPQVSNKKTIRSLAKKMLKKNNSKSRVIITSIALCSFMFAMLFTVGINLIDRFQESNMRQIGSSADCGFKYLTEEEYDLIKNDTKLKDVSRSIYIGDVVNKELAKLRTEVRWVDEVNAEKSFSKPEVGQLPKNEDEIAISNLVLNELGYDADSVDKYESLIGKKIKLSLDCGETDLDKEFKVVGIFTGDRVSIAQSALISKAFQEKYVPTPTLSYYDSETPYSDPNGRISADVDFKIPFNINGQIEKMIVRDGLPENVEVGSNWGSIVGTGDMTTILLAAFLLLIIFASGFLIINNVYRINVYSDIRSFGLLKTIGCSSKQLKSLVKWQSIYLSVPGILIGLVLGIVVGAELLPIVSKQLVLAETTKNSFSVNPLIILFAGLFSYVTVRLSVRKSMKIVSKVSPIEAVRFLEGTNLKWKTRKKKASTISPLTLAKRNLSRDKKKAVFVILSLSLSVVIMNTVYSLVSGFDEDKYIQTFVKTDFSVADATLDNPAIFDGKNTEAIGDKFIDNISNQKGIEELGNIYIEQDVIQTFTDEDFDKIDERLLKDPALSGDMSQVINPETNETLYDYYKATKEARTQIYGMDDFVIKNLPVVAGSVDLDKFKTGKYIIVNGCETMGDDLLVYFKPGEKITVSNKDGEQREYEVMAVVDLSLALRLQMFAELDLNYILPHEEFNDFCGERDAMRCVFNVDDKHENDIEKWMDKYTTGVESNLKYTSRKVYRDEFKEFTSMFVIVGGLITVILALIGILNLTNTLVTSIMSRRVELAMLEAVGETKRMQKKSICLEGVLYSLLSVFIGLILSGLFTVLLIRPVGAGMWFFKWHFTLAPVFIIMPFMIIIAAIIPYVIYNKFMKASVVERLRLTEA